MRNDLKLFLSGVVVASALVGSSGAQSQNQSLGEYARAIKKTKPAQPSPAKPKVYDNENMPTSGTLSVVGNASPDSTSPDTKDETKTDANAKSADPSKAEPKTNGADEKKQEAQIKPGQSMEDRKQALDAWQKKLDGQKDKVSLASRELDVLQREYQLKVSEFYSDATHRVQNPNALFDDDSKYKQQIADKQKTLDDAKSQLSDMQDEARRAGAPSSVTE
ncbi:MAG: hypothetical protein DMG93_16775 [Acidobacteria bacterium]|nr:MAG: hypothetical protein DMG93_16775 [Acidobacteriota bacterium]